MGLEISTGEYACMLKEDPEEAEYIEDELKVVNTFLKENNIKEHSEPRDLPEAAMSCAGSLPYGFFHYLRRVYALHCLEKEVNAVSGGKLTDEDHNLIDKADELFESHLLCHSDAEGYYVPIAFERVIVSEELPGEMLGSSQTLLEELIEISCLIGIDIHDGEISKELGEALALLEPNHPFGKERFVWFRLYESCIKSIKYNTVILFG